MAKIYNFSPVNLHARNFPFDFDRIGKTIFTTREAAEAALKEAEK